MSMPQFRHLPDHTATPKFQYLYVAEFSDGVVKIGVTWNPQARAAALQLASRRKIARVHAQPITGRSARHDAERVALARARQIGVTRGNSREFFDNLRFGEAVTIVSQIARRDIKWMQAA